MSFSPAYHQVCSCIRLRFRMTQSSFLVPGEGEEGSDVKVGSVEEEGSQCSSGFGSLPRKDKPSVISHGKCLCKNDTLHVTVKKKTLDS